MRGAPNACSACARQIRLRASDQATVHWATRNQQKARTGIPDGMQRLHAIIALYKPHHATKSWA